MKVYLVGGAVRDMIMGITPNDRDYVVVGSTPEEMISLGYKQVGAAFPVFLHPTTGEEYALARTEKKVGEGYHGFTTEFNPSVTIEEDLARRDFAINAMAYDEATKTLIDPYGGQDDIRNKIIRHTSEAFREDPLRVVRMARFAARFVGFKIHADTLELAAEIVESGEMDSISDERYIAEIEKMLDNSVDPAIFMHTLNEINALHAVKFFKNTLSYDFASDFKPIMAMPKESRFAIFYAMNSTVGGLQIPKCLPNSAIQLNKTVEAFVKARISYSYFNTQKYNTEDVYDVLVSCKAFQKDNVSQYQDFCRFLTVTKHYEFLAKTFEAVRVASEVLSDDFKHLQPPSAIGAAIKAARITKINSIL